MGQPLRIVIVGSGFGGYYAAHKLGRKLRPDEATVTLISDTDGFLYQPLLPDVAVGALTPRSVTVSLTDTLRGVDTLRGLVTSVDLDQREVEVRMSFGPERTVPYDRLLVAAGGVTHLLDIPGLAEHAIGFKTVVEALYLRDHVLGRLERANDEPDAARRRADLTFVVVGAGYAGTELVAQFSRLTDNLLARFDRLSAADVSWLLLDVAPAVMPELGTDLGESALQLLRRRNVDVRLKTSITEITDRTVTLTDGSELDCSTVVWCAGVTANPLVESLGLPMTKGRLVVQGDLSVAERPELLAIGDAAAVPDLTQPPTEDGPTLCAPTAQHAMRQGKAAARNLLADVRGVRRRSYRHHDLGLVVDLGGPDAAAKPLGVRLKGRPAKLVTRGYHVLALPTVRRRLQVLSDWALAGRTPDDVSFGIVPKQQATAEAAEHRA